MTTPVSEQSTVPVVASEHGSSCGCQRCRGFEPGNKAALTHGAYSKLSLQPRAQKLRADLAALAPFLTDADGPILDVLSVTLAQVERAGLVLAVEQAESVARVQVGEPPSDRLDRLAADCRAWVKTAARLLGELGMTPSSRARILRDAGVGKAAAAAAALRDLDALEAEGRRLRLAVDRGAS